MTKTSTRESKKRQDKKNMKNVIASQKLNPSFSQQLNTDQSPQKLRETILMNKSTSTLQTKRDKFVN